MSLHLLRHHESVEDAINGCNPVGHWPLTEFIGGLICPDSSMNGRDGTLNGSVTPNNITAPDGLPAALFAGGSVRVNDFAAHSVDSNLGFTCGALVKFDSVPSTQRWIMTKGTTSQFEWAMFAYTAAELGFSMWTLTGATVSARQSSAAVFGTGWQLVIMCVQNRAASAQIDGYNNGAAVTMGSTVTTGTPYADGTQGIWIGERPDGSADPMNGYIRNAFVCQEVLNIGSIKRIDAACRRGGFY